MARAELTAVRRRCKGDGCRAGVFFALSSAPALRDAKKRTANLHKTRSWLRQPLSFARAQNACALAPVTSSRACATPVRARHAKTSRAREGVGSRERGGAREPDEKAREKNLKNLRGKHGQIVYRGKQYRIRASVGSVGHCVSADAPAVIGSGLHAHRLQHNLFRF